MRRQVKCRSDSPANSGDRGNCWMAISSNWHLCPQRVLQQLPPDVDRPVQRICAFQQGCGVLFGCAGLSALAYFGGGGAFLDLLVKNLGPTPIH